MAKVTKARLAKHKDNRAAWFRSLVPTDKPRYTRAEVIAIMKLVAARVRKLHIGEVRRRQSRSQRP